MAEGATSSATAEPLGYQMSKRYIAHRYPKLEVTRPVVNFLQANQGIIPRNCCAVGMESGCAPEKLPPGISGEHIKGLKR